MHMLGMGFISLRREMLFQNWIKSKSNLVLAGEQADEVDRLSHLDSCITRGGRILEEVSSRMRKARLGFTKVRHLWCPRHIRLSIKVRL